MAVCEQVVDETIVRTSLMICLMHQRNVLLKDKQRKHCGTGNAEEVKKLTKVSVSKLYCAECETIKTSFEHFLMRHVQFFLLGVGLEKVGQKLME